MKRQAKNLTHHIVAAPTIKKSAARNCRRRRTAPLRYGAASLNSKYTSKVFRHIERCYSGFLCRQFWVISLTQHTDLLDADLITTRLLPLKLLHKTIP